MMEMSKCDLSVFIKINYRRRQTFMHGNESGVALWTAEVL